MLFSDGDSDVHGIDRLSVMPEDAPSREEGHAGSDGEGNEPSGAARALGLLQSVRNDSSFSDAVIEVASSTFHVHRVVVAALSPFFRNAFSNGFAESTRRHVKINDTTEQVVQTLLDYAYGSDVTESCQNDLALAMDLWELAHRLQVPHLKDLAAKAAVCNPPVATCVQVYQHAKLLHHRTAMSVMFRFIANHFTCVSETQPFTKLAFEDFGALLASSETIATEPQIFEAVAVWVSADRDARAKHLDSLLVSIHFERFTEPELKMVADFDQLLSRELLARILTSSARRTISVKGMAVVGHPRKRSFVHCNCSHARQSSANHYHRCRLRRFGTSSGGSLFEVRRLSSSEQKAESDDKWDTAVALPVYLGPENVGERIAKEFYINHDTMALTVRFVLSTDTFTASMVLDRRLGDITERDVTQSPLPLKDDLQYIGMALQVVMLDAGGVQIGSAYKQFQGVQLYRNTEVVEDNVNDEVWDGSVTVTLLNKQSVDGLLINIGEESGGYTVLVSVQNFPKCTLSSLCA